MRNDMITKSATVLTVALAAFTGVAAFADDTTAPTASATPTPAAPAPAAPAAPAATAPAAPATPTGIQYGGLVDGYYQFQFSNPKSANIATTPISRVYDFRHNTPTLALAELNVYKTATPDGFGWKSTFIAGDVADVNHFATQGSPALATGEGRFKNVQQLYGTYLSKAGYGVDFGKFYTPFGYEVTESNANYNYSRSLPYSLLPVYHFGARFFTPSYKGLTFNADVVQAIFNTSIAGVQNDKKQPAFVGQINYTDPAGKFVAIENLGLGKDKLGGPTSNKVVLSDTDFTYNATPAISVGLNYVYLKVTPDADGSTAVTTNGWAVYYHQTLTPKTAFALRYSGYKTDAVSPDFKPYEFTGTYEIKSAANFLTRFEYRHDGTNGDYPIFLDKDSNPTKSNQDTLTASEVFTF